MASPTVKREPEAPTYDSNALELSSAEEEDYRRSRSRRKPKTLSNITTHEAPQPLNGAQYNEIVDESMLPKFRTMAELMVEHGHLDTHKAQNRMCEMAISKLTSKQRSSSSVTHNIEELINQLKPVDHEQASKVIPWEEDLYHKKLSELPRAEYYFRSVQTQLSHEELVKALRQRQVELPLLTSEYEMGIMAEAGTFMVGGEPRVYPACYFGDACVTNVYEIDDPSNVGKFVSMALMYPEEYDIFRANGTLPMCIRPCILCCRKRLEDYVLWLREVTMSSESAEASSKGAKKKGKEDVFQLFRNITDGAGGYYHSYMLIPRADECIVDPICMFTCSPLKRAKLANGRRCIDQRVMMWKPTETVKPKIGENLLNF